MGFWDETMAYGPAGGELYAAQGLYSYFTGPTVPAPPTDGTAPTAPAASAPPTMASELGTGIGQGVGNALGKVIIGLAVVAGVVVVVAGVGTAVYFGPEITAALSTANKVKRR